MAALSSTNPSLLDWHSSLDPDGSIAAVIEVLNETNEILQDITFMEGNLPTGHRTTIRSGLPTPTWRKLYGGVTPDKSLRAQITESCGMLEAYAEVDKALADLNGNSAEFRLQEARAHLESMSQSVAQALFYGNVSSNPEQFEGLSNRYNSLSAENGDNIIDAAGASTDNRSIWLVVWGPNTVQGIVPKGSQAGIQMTDMGEVTIEDASNGSNTGRMQGYRTHFRWDVGLCVKDWRYAVRIANIDYSDLSPTASSGANLPQLMYQAMRLIPNLSSGRPVFYASRDVWTTLQQQMENRVASSTLTVENVGGVMTEMFHGVPLRRCDALSSDEAEVT